MTKKHYELIARAIKKQWETEARIYGKGERSLVVHNTALRLAYALEDNDPKFNLSKFLRACGIEA